MLGTFTVYGALPRERHNILRFMFDDSRVRAAQGDWWSVARFVVAACRANIARAGAISDAPAAHLVDELTGQSDEFAALWRENDVVASGKGVKRLDPPQAGLLALEFSSFAVEGRPAIGMVVYNSASPAVTERIRALIADSGGAASLG